jgi:hypothetical protein
MKILFRPVLAALLLGIMQVAYAQVPAYNSYPSAPAVIFLDFDGHYISGGSSWNGGNPFAVGPSNLSQAQIAEVFNRVSEDYRPFNINITTDSTVYWSALPNRRMRVVLTITSDWYGSAGGVAWTNSFRWGDNTPCFVFTALLNYKAKNIAEAAAHEAGHTLGLRHQASYNDACGKLTDYNAGTGDGEIGWAPIMGVGYYRNFTVWHNGPSQYGCSMMQNDLEIITSPTNGFGYRADDHSSSFASATATNFSANQFTVSGVVERTDDQDLFRFVLPKTGQLMLNAIPYNVGSGNIGSNLDLQVQLIDASFQVVNTWNPGTALSSFADTVLEAGVYYLLIDGQGNQYASEYGSLGSYSLQGNFFDLSPLPLRQLELKGSITNNRHQFSWIIDADEQVRSQTLEVSVNGRDFEQVGRPVAGQRLFSYAPAHAGTLWYRLQAGFDNGRSYYSNIVSLKSTGMARPAVQGNFVGSSLTVSSPSAFGYTILDPSGRLVSKGTLRTGMNNISTENFAPGLYVIQYSNGQELFVERFGKR